MSYESGENEIVAGLREIVRVMLDHLMENGRKEDPVGVDLGTDECDGGADEAPDVVREELAEKLAEKLAEELPKALAVEATDEGITISECPNERIA